MTGDVTGDGAATGRPAPAVRAFPVRLTPY